MSERELSGDDRFDVRCPNCGLKPLTEYDNSNPDVREFDCDNPNCRCTVFRVGGQ